MFNDADENAFIREKRDLNQISEIRLIVKDVYSHNNHSKMQWYSTYEFMSKVMKKMKALLTSTIGPDHLESKISIILGKKI